MSERCATCKWWEPLAGSEKDPAGVKCDEWHDDERSCPDCETERRYGICLDSIASSPYRGHETGKPAYAVDGSDYYAALRTLPDFGCTQWTAKP